jgi:hypothetical protein
MERSELFDLMGELQLYGMKARQFWPTEHLPVRWIMRFAGHEGRKIECSRKALPKPDYLLAVKDNPADAPRRDRKVFRNRARSRS